MPAKRRPSHPAPQARSPHGRASSRAALRRFVFTAGAICLLVALSTWLTGFLSEPSPDPFPLAGAEASGTPTPEPTPSPEPTLTPTPRAYAPFGAQYGYGGTDLIPETPPPEPSAALQAPVFTPLTAPEPSPSGYETLRKGATGDNVQRMQEALRTLGYLSDAADGNFGANTQAAVIFFQAVNGLTADGIAGQKTLTLLYSGSALPASAAPDMDWLILVNRKHTIDKSFIPSDLVSIQKVLPSSLVKVKYRGTQANRTAVEALGRMLEAAAADGVTNWQISSAYRTYADQQKLVDNSVAAYLRNHTDWSKKQARSATYNTVAPAGTSEHQTGLAFDVTVPGVSFAGTEQQKWLHKHCHEYGFIVRYTAEKQKITGFIAEAWHIRYVGVEPAAIMVQNNWCLEEYLEHMGI